MAGQECGKDQAELWYGGTIAFPSEHKTKLVRNRSVPFRSVPFRSVPFRPRLNMALIIDVVQKLIQNKLMLVMTKLR